MSAEMAHAVVGQMREGSCAECGADRAVRIGREDVDLTDRESLEEYGEPTGVYRYCPDCHTPQASILLR